MVSEEVFDPIMSSVHHVYNDIQIGVEESGDCVLEVCSCCCRSARLECEMLGESEVRTYSLNITPPSYVPPSITLKLEIIYTI